MNRVLEGKPHGKGRKIGIAVSKFNDFITRRLLDACLNELSRCGVASDDILVVWVPGSFEIPLTAVKLARKKNIHAVICLGAVIRGETFHFDLICREAARGIARASFVSGKPVIFGVLTTDTVEQADRRCEEQGDNKGKDAARAALEMIDVLRRL